MKIPILKSGGCTTIIREKDGAHRVSRVESEYTFAFELRNSARVMVNSAKEIENISDNNWKLKAFIK